MTIIKPGLPPSTAVQFSCGTCHCVFTANEYEYTPTSVMECGDAKCKCPNCGTWCYSYHGVSWVEK